MRFFAREHTSDSSTFFMTCGMSFSYKGCPCPTPVLRLQVPTVAPKYLCSGRQQPMYRYGQSCFRRWLRSVPPMWFPKLHPWIEKGLSSQLIHCDSCKAEFGMVFWNWEVGSGMHLLLTFTFHGGRKPGKRGEGRCRQCLLNLRNIRRIVLHGKK